MIDLVERARREGSFVSANGVVRELYFKMIDEIERLKALIDEADAWDAKQDERIAKLEAFVAHLLGECPPNCKNCGE